MPAIGARSGFSSKRLSLNYQSIAIAASAQLMRPSHSERTAVVVCKQGTDSIRTASAPTIKYEQLEA